jgi:dihydrodipicolinate synthase/N-acetylneuraminate lyase
MKPSAQRSDLEQGRALWAKLYPICEFLETVNYPGGIKTGLELVGQNPGPTRRPILPMSKANRDECARLLRAAGADVIDE